MQSDPLAKPNLGDLLKVADTPVQLNGKNVLYAGLTVTLYFKPPFVEAVNEKLTSCMDEYLSLAPSHPKLGGLPTSRQYVDFTKKRFTPPSETIAKLNDDRTWSFSYIWTDTDEEASLWNLEVIRESSTVNWTMSYLHVTFPFHWSANQKLPQLVKTWSERLNAFHGYVGAALLLPSDEITVRMFESEVYEAVKRFPGLNFDRPASQGTHLLQGIKTVDWLTILGKPFVDKLGGLDTLHAQLTAEFGLTPLANGGLIIQAGSVPQLGDAAAGDRPKLYVDLNRILKPIRVVDYPYSFQSGQFAKNYMNRDAARAWIARFD